MKAGWKSTNSWRSPWWTLRDTTRGCARTPSWIKRRSEGEEIVQSDQNSKSKCFVFSSLSASVQTLEQQCEDLQRCLDEVVLRRGTPDSERDRDSPVMTKLCNQPTPLRQHFNCQVRFQLSQCQLTLELLAVIGSLYVFSKLHNCKQGKNISKILAHKMLW